MELRKITERALRTYDENNAATETVESADYVIFDDNGNNIGNMTAYGYSASLNLNVPATSITEGVQKIASILNAKVNEEGGEA